MATSTDPASGMQTQKKSSALPKKAGLLTNRATIHLIPSMIVAAVLLFALYGLANLRPKTNGSTPAPNSQHGMSASAITLLKADADSASSCPQVCLDGVWPGQLLTEAIATLRQNTAVTGLTVITDSGQRMEWESRGNYRATAYAGENEIRAVSAVFFELSPVDSVLEILGVPEGLEVRLSPAWHSAEEESSVSLLYPQQKMEIEALITQKAGLLPDSPVYGITLLAPGEEMYYCPRRDFLTTWKGYAGTEVYYTADGLLIDRLYPSSDSCGRDLCLYDDESGEEFVNPPYGAEPCDAPLLPDPDGAVRDPRRYGWVKAGLERMLSQRDGWWGSSLESAEIVAWLIFEEAGHYLYDNHVIDPLTDLMTRKYNHFCSDSPWSARCINGFWTHFRVMGDVFNPDHNDYILRLQQDFLEFDRNRCFNVCTDLARRVTQRPEIGRQVAGTPGQWGHIYEGERELPASATVLARTNVHVNGEWKVKVFFLDYATP